MRESWPPHMHAGFATGRLCADYIDLGIYYLSWKIMTPACDSVNLAILSIRQPAHRSTAANKLVRRYSLGSEQSQQCGLTHCGFPAGKRLTGRAFHMSLSWLTLPSMLAPSMAPSEKHSPLLPSQVCLQHYCTNGRQMLNTQYHI